ncbi:cytochrome C biogenesis protein CcdA, partial [Klebsiella pneumoniae]
LLYTNRSILFSSIVRIINTLSLFGFAVIMPMMFVDELGFTTSEWLQVWAAFFFTTIFSNVFWGIMAEKMGWMKVIRWFGCIVSVYNLSAGLSNFLAPAIAVVLLPYFSTIGVVIAYTALYILAFFLCPLIRVEQPGFTSDQHAKPFTANAAES